MKPSAEFDLHRDRAKSFSPLSQGPACQLQSHLPTKGISKIPKIMETPKGCLAHQLIPSTLGWAGGEILGNTVIRGLPGNLGVFLSCWPLAGLRSRTGKNTSSNKTPCKNFRDLG